MRRSKAGPPGASPYAPGNRAATVRSIAMRFTFSLVLLTGLAVVSQGSPEKPQPSKPAVPVVKADAVISFTANQLVNVVRRSTPIAGHEASTPVSSLQEGLPFVQKAFKRPIVAMAESEGWFFYATTAGLGDEI